MIDGINITHYTPENTHLKSWDIWETLVNTKSLQRVTDTDSANFRGLDMCMKQRQSKDGYRFELKGSLHKYYNYGLHNYNQYTFNKLVQTINGLTNVIGISANDLELHGLEIGVNIPLPFAPTLLLKNLVSYGNKGFALIDKKQAKLGLQCALSQYTLKIYNKGLQSKTKDNILRFEVKVNKMAVLEKYGLKTLSDLQQPKKVYPLVFLLLDTAKRIIWTDTKTDLNQMTAREQKQWLYYSNPRSWEQMSNKKRFYHLEQWNILLKKYDVRNDFENMVLSVWNGLFDTETKAQITTRFYRPTDKEKAQKLGLFYRPNENNKAQKIRTFLPLEYTVKKSTNPPLKITPNNININNYIKSAKNTKKTRPYKPKFCISCGADISHQRKQSKFCSARYVGHTKAKQCRNKDSNKRNHIKEKIIKAMQHQNFIAITYTDKNGISYTDTLHPTELHITRLWLDRIQSVKILPTIRSEPPETLDGIKAKDYIRSITKIH